jgi:tripartite-type tricarboxylate transporter receptor subunit TctC
MIGPSKVTQSRAVNDTAHPHWRRPARALAGMLLLLPTSTGALAQSEGYFKGKTVTINIAGTSGGGIDVGARIVARYIGKYLPGNPQVIAQNMPGAGGVRALEYLVSQAPKDGTVMAAFASGPILEQQIGPRKPAYAIGDFVAIGSLDRDVSFCTTWFKSPVKTLEQARKSEVTVAGTGAGSNTDIDPMVLNEVLGTKFKVITGYLGTQETALALERGEVDGRCGFGFASLKASKPDWLKENKLNFLVQMGLEAHPLAKDVPLALDLADTPEKKAMVRLMSAPLGIGRPYLAPPGVPPERAAELRKAYMDTMADPEFKAEFAKASGGDPAEPTSGAEMQKVLLDMQKTPKAVVERLRVLLNP